MSTTLDQRIRDAYESLPKSERRLADVVIEHRAGVAAYSATELAQQAGVSKATAVRFFRRLGYRDFNAVRRESRDTPNAGSPLSALAELSASGGPDGDFGRHLRQDLNNLSRTAEGIPAEAIDRAVRALAGAERIWVLGFRNNYALAIYARGLLINVKEDVRLLPIGGFTLAEDMASMTSRDVALVFGFRRRLPVLRNVLRATSKAGARIVYLTDHSAGPTAKLSSVVLRCHNRGASLFDSYVAALSLTNYLCAAAAMAAGRKGRTRLARIERIHESLQDFGDRKQD